MMRVLFFGMNGPFARAALAALLAAGVTPCALVLPAARDAPFAMRRVKPPGGAIMLGQPAARADLGAFAIERDIPLFELARATAPEALATIAALEPDVACVACWPQRIPPALLDIPRHGFFNIHPSLLPAFRGPEPLFWTMCAAAPAGVTIHRMDTGLDTGPIAAQAPVELPDGLRIEAIEQRCAEAAGRLLVEILTHLAAGQLVLRAQPAGGSYNGAPGPADFVLDTSWTARRAFNFMRAAAAWGEPFIVTAGGETLRLTAAHSYDPVAALEKTLERAGDIVRVQFSPGVVSLRD
jgi:methionyl-tRNA formyltransferase